MNKFVSILKNIVIGVVLIIVYVIFVVALYEGSKIASALILIGSVGMLVVLRKEKFNFLHVTNIFAIIYSLLVLSGLSTKIEENSRLGGLENIMIYAAKRLSVFSIIEVIMFLSLGTIVFVPFIQYIRKTIADKKYGALPEIANVGKKNKRVYFRYDYSNKKVKLIYRNERRVKILDSFDYDFVSGDKQYSLELNDNELVVKAYNVYSHAVIMEKSYNISLK